MLFAPLGHRLELLVVDTFLETRNYKYIAKRLPCFLSCVEENQFYSSKSMFGMNGEHAKDTFMVSLHRSY